MRFVVRFDNFTTKRYYYKTIFADSESEAHNLATKRYTRKGFMYTSKRGYYV